MTESKPNGSPAEFPAEQPVERKRHWVRRFIIKCVTFYFVVAVLVAVFQRSLIYVPFQVDRITVADAGHLAGRTEHVTVVASVGTTLNGWKVRSPGERQRTILYCPGNAANRINRVSTLDILSENGSEIFLFDYRGYGENAGTPSEEAIAEDMRTIWNWLTTEQGIPPEEIVVYGQSLGGGVAVRLVSDLAAEQISPGGLLLVSTFSSMVDAASNRFPWLPVSLLLQDRFPSEDRIGKITCPILHIHGARDRIVPIGLGEKLFARAPKGSRNKVERKFVTLPLAGHNDILQSSREAFRAAALEFLAQVGRGE
ncbi:MAG: alpha/beta hydrolase [Planctomycetota bacterium]|nr:alpha/beta hydrolase [Planctomycetota bacterium]MDA1250462.1 alpha/beta hydrolase [Planctomycetota bacterium]